MKKYIILLMLMLFVWGCHEKEIVSLTHINHLNETADEMQQRDYDYFFQVEVDTSRKDLKVMEIRHYKDGEIVDHPILFMKTNENENDIPPIQYIYIGYQFLDQGGIQNADSLKVTFYFYGPATDTIEEYPPHIVESIDDKVNCQRDQIKFLQVIEEKNQRYYICPVLLEKEVDENLSITEMIDQGYEMIVFVIR